MTIIHNVLFYTDVQTQSQYYWTATIIHVLCRKWREDNQQEKILKWASQDIPILFDLICLPAGYQDRSSYGISFSFYNVLAGLLVGLLTLGVGPKVTFCLLLLFVFGLYMDGRLGHHSFRSYFESGFGLKFFLRRGVAAIVRLVLFLHNCKHSENLFFQRQWFGKNLRTLIVNSLFEQERRRWHWVPPDPKGSYC